MTSIEIAARNIRTAAEIVVAQFAEEANKVAADPARKEAAEQLFASIKHEVNEHIVPAFEASYAANDSITCITIANCKAEKTVAEYGRIAQRVCGMFMRELAKLNKDL